MKIQRRGKGIPKFYFWVAVFILSSLSVVRAEETPFIYDRQETTLYTVTADTNGLLLESKLRTPQANGASTPSSQARFPRPVFRSLAAFPALGDALWGVTMSGELTMIDVRGFGTQPREAEISEARIFGLDMPFPVLSVETICSGQLLLLGTPLGIAMADMTDLIRSLDEQRRAVLENRKRPHIADPKLQWLQPSILNTGVESMFLSESDGNCRSSKSELLVSTSGGKALRFGIHLAPKQVLKKSTELRNASLDMPVPSYLIDAQEKAQILEFRGAVTENLPSATPVEISGQALLTPVFMYSDPFARDVLVFANPTHPKTLRASIAAIRLNSERKAKNAYDSERRKFMMHVFTGAFGPWGGWLFPLRFDDQLINDIVEPLFTADTAAELLGRRDLAVQYGRYAGYGLAVAVGFGPFAATLTRAALLRNVSSISTERSLPAAARQIAYALKYSPTFWRLKAARYAESFGNGLHRLRGRPISLQAERELSQFIKSHTLRFADRDIRVFEGVNTAFSTATKADAILFVLEFIERQGIDQIGNPQAWKSLFQNPEFYVDMIASYITVFTYYFIAGTNLSHFERGLIYGMMDRTTVVTTNYAVNKLVDLEVKDLTQGRQDFEWSWGFVLKVPQARLTWKAIQKYGINPTTSLTNGKGHAIQWVSESLSTWLYVHRSSTYYDRHNAPHDQEALDLIAKITSDREDKVYPDGKPLMIPIVFENRRGGFDLH